MENRKKNILVALVIATIIIIGLGIGLSGRQPMKPEPKYTGLTAVPSQSEICFDASNKSSYEKYVNEIEEFMTLYNDVKFGGNIVDCGVTDRRDGQICGALKSWLFPCGNPDWGYEKGQPCVVLSYANDPNYKPTPYQTLKEIPAWAPDSMRQYAEEELDDGGSFNPRRIRLFCTHVKTENYRAQGFHKDFFPNSHFEGYMPPIAAVRFSFLDADGNIIPGEYNVECTLWSKEPPVDEVKKVSFKIKQGFCQQE